MAYSLARYFVILGLQLSSVFRVFANSIEISTSEAQAGHYPYKRCHMTNVMLKPDGFRGVFYTRNDVAQCTFTDRIWHFGVDSNVELSACHVTVDIGHVVLIYFSQGASNYYHLHWDTMIPLYKSLYEDDKNPDQTKAILPSVETTRLKEIDWNTEAFSGRYEASYWNQLTQMITGNHLYIPLDKYFLEKNETICFKELYFGTTAWDRSESDMILGFIRHVKSYYNIISLPFTGDRIGIISRKNRRRILNEDELVKSLKHLAPTELINFDGLSHKQQIEVMQRYTVVTGMNGAGLMNCIYLPPTSVCIQLVPYGAHGYLNYDEYGKLLKSRGPYAEWHNTHEDMDRPNGGPHSADTTVNTDELRSLIADALKQAQAARNQAITAGERSEL